MVLSLLSIGEKKKKERKKITTKASSFATTTAEAMASNAVAAQEYWGYLINPDKSPTPVFEQLLLGVANYIVSDYFLIFGPCATED